MAIFVNPFHVIRIREHSAEISGVNQLFGIPAGIDLDRWPEAGGNKLHHLLALSVDTHDLPLPDEVSVISIFLGAPRAVRGEAGSPFVVVPSTSRDVEGHGMADYPSDYKPWWDDGHPFAAQIRDGLGFDLEEQDGIPEDVIRGMLLQEDVYPDYDVINAFAAEQSYVGGFPIWTQDDETPYDPEGERTHFVLMINGSNQYLQTSPIGGQVSYLFMDDNGNPYWAAQD